MRMVTHWYLVSEWGKGDNGIREKGKNNKNMVESETDKDDEHLYSTQMHSKDMHIQKTFKKQDKLLCGTKVQQKSLVGRRS